MLEQNQERQFNILCVGERCVGKSDFLQKYTQDSPEETLYRIYAKKWKDSIVYFHQLANEEELYLQNQYDGILFFVDLTHHWQVQENVLKWMELYSKNSGNNIFKIPIQVIALNSRQSLKEEDKKKYKLSLKKQLISIMESTQIIMDCDLYSIDSNMLSAYFEELEQEQAKCLKCTQYVYWKLYGISEYAKSFITSAKLFFFRLGEAFENLRGKKRSLHVAT